MKNLKLNPIITKSLAVLSVMTCLSCSDDLESKDLKVYLITPTGENKVEVAISHPTSEGKLVMKLPVRSTRELVADANVVATIDESLVNAYNAEHGTAYKLLPATLADISSELLFAKGSSESTDSIGLVCQDVKTLEEPGYLLPVTLSSLSSDDKGVVISSNLNTAYFVIDVKEYRMYNTTQAVGALKERIGWKITGNDGKEYPELLDGNNRTGVADDGKQLLLTVDMGSVSSVKGLRLTPRNSVSFDLDAISVEVSENGQEWSSLKELVLNQAVSKPGVTACQDVGFYKTWSARYIRIKAFRVTSAMVTTVSEISIFE